MQFVKSLPIVQTAFAFCASKTICGIIFIPIKSAIVLVLQFSLAYSH